MHLPKPTSLLLKSASNVKAVEVFSWSSAEEVVRHWEKVLSGEEFAGVQVRALMPGGLVLELGGVRLKEVEVEWAFAQALWAALGVGSEAPAHGRPTLRSFNWRLIAQAMGMSLSRVREGEREVVLSWLPSGKKNRTFPVVDNGGEFCLYEESLKALHTGVGYTSEFVGHGVERKVGDLTIAYRLKCAVEGREINWRVDMDAPV